MWKRIFSLVFVFMILVGCSIDNNSTLSLPTQTSIHTNPSPEVNVWNYFPNLTPIPTLSVLQQADLMSLLKSDICNLPCYLGIEPGKTTFDETNNIISRLGGTLRSDYENFYEGYPEKSPLRWRSYIFDVDSIFYIDIAIAGKDKQVQQIIFDASSNSQTLFYEAWARYSIESIFNIYGEPDQILIYAGERYDIRVVYLNDGVIIDWSGAQNNNYFEHKFCPKFSEENIVNLQIIIVDPKSAFENIPPSYIGFEEMWKSIDETLGISKTEFYESVIYNSDTCFEVKTINTSIP